MNLTFTMFLSVLVPALDLIGTQLDPASRGAKLLKLLVELARSFQAPQVSRAARGAAAKKSTPEPSVTVAISRLPPDTTAESLLDWADLQTAHIAAQRGD